MLGKLFIVVQYLIPARALGRVVYALARSERAWVARPLINVFMRLYSIDLTEAEFDRAQQFKSFNAFFTRRLRPQARPIGADPQDLCSPADGYLQQHGTLNQGQLIQAKGIEYNAQQLLGCSADESQALAQGSYLSVYLAPHNYHRVHMPLAGRVERIRLIRGARFSVNKATTHAIPNLFARNERVVCRCRGVCGTFWVVFVGAMNVASISTLWHGELMHGQDPQLPADSHLNKGDYLGHFNLGSTVIILFPSERVRWSKVLRTDQPLRVGESIGRLIESA